jgi:protoporphyrinogen oxidase
VASIVIVGGGVAGLTCAWRLRHAGHDVEVLECAPEPGGRLRSENHGDFALECGARSVASGHHNWHGVVLALGLGDRVYALPSASRAVLRDGALHRADLDAPLGLLTTSLLSAGARVRLSRLAFEVLRHVRDLDPLHPERAAALDREDLAAGTRRMLGEENLEYLLEPVFASRFGSEPEDLSWAVALLTLRRRAQGFREQSLRGGLSGLTRALARRVPVRTDCEVVAIETQTMPWSWPCRARRRRACVRSSRPASAASSRRCDTRGASSYTCCSTGRPRRCPGPMSRFRGARDWISPASSSTTTGWARRRSVRAS